ncbi:MAG: hypothetical protein FWE90_14265, partial [Defluviitaleaceae bacterium]|nr:hypothetical protein [Defluviitaleaceae bacterium]
MIFITIILGNGILLYYILFIERKLTIEDVRRETRHMMELEQSQYREVEKRHEEFTKIRHDFNNQLAVIGRLMRNGEESTARDMIDTLSHEII